MRTTRRDETRRDEHCCQERSISIDSALKQNLWICPSVSDWNRVKFRWERNEFLSTPLEILHNGHTTHNNAGQLVQYRIDGWMNAEQVSKRLIDKTRERFGKEWRQSYVILFSMKCISLLSNSPIKSWVDWWIGDDRSITSVSSRGPSPLSSFTVGHLWNVIMMMWRGTSHLNNIHNLHVNRHWRDGANCWALNHEILPDWPSAPSTRFQKHTVRWWLRELTPAKWSVMVTRRWFW